MKSLKDFFSKPVFILTPLFLALFIVFIPFIYPLPEFSIGADGRIQNIPLGFPLTFAEAVDTGGVDGIFYNFSLFPFIIDILFYFGLLLLLSYWISKKISSKRKGNSIR